MKVDVGDPDALFEALQHTLNAKVVEELLNFLEAHSYEASFECACDAITDPVFKPCGACRLRRSLGRRLGPVASQWLAKTSSERERFIDHVLGGLQP